MTRDELFALIQEVSPETKRVPPGLYALARAIERHVLERKCVTPEPLAPFVSGAAQLAAPASEPTQDFENECGRLRNMLRMADRTYKDQERCIAQLRSVLAIEQQKIAQLAAPEWKRCPHCFTHEVELERTCHNSSCAGYASAESVYCGWQQGASK